MSSGFVTGGMPGRACAAAGLRLRGEGAWLGAGPGEAGVDPAGTRTAGRGADGEVHPTSASTHADAHDRLRSDILRPYRPRVAWAGSLLRGRDEPPSVLDCASVPAAGHVHDR